MKFLLLSLILVTSSNVFSKTCSLKEYDKFNKRISFFVENYDRIHKLEKRKVRELYVLNGTTCESFIAKRNCFRKMMVVNKLEYMLFEFEINYRRSAKDYAEFKQSSEKEKQAHIDAMISIGRLVEVE